LKARAAFLVELNKPMQIQEIELKPLLEGELIVRIEAAGICGSDTHMFKGNDPRLKLPIVLGHEGVGIVEEIKSEKKDIFNKKLKKGDMVIWDRGMTCNNCYYCLIKKEPWLCPNREVYGITRNGCYSEYLTLDKRTKIIKIEKDIDPSILVPSSCSGATSAHAVELCDIKLDSTVVIIGAGQLGVYCSKFISQKGAKNIIVLDTINNRLDLIKEFGANKTFNVNRVKFYERKSYIYKITEDSGADIVIDCSGNQSAIRDGIKLTAPGGSFLIPGVAIPLGGMPIELYEDISKKNLRMQGVWVSSTNNFSEAVNLTLRNKNLFKKIISYKIKLNDINEAFSDFDKNMNIAKGVVVS